MDDINMSVCARCVVVCYRLAVRAVCRQVQSGERVRIMAALSGKQQNGTYILKWRRRLYHLINKRFSESI